MLFEPIDAYCERVGLGLFAEPLNVGASILLVLAGHWLWRSLADQPRYNRLATLVALVGATSAILHLWPNRFTSALLLASIAGFALLCLYRVNVDLLGLSRRLSLVATGVFLPFLVGAFPLMTLSTGALGTLALAPFPVLMLGYAAVFRPHSPDLARAFLMLALLLAVALGLRAADGAMCSRWPQGTHFLYILIGGLTLVGLVRVTARHALAGAVARG